jgi:hypothetical protein
LARSHRAILLSRNNTHLHFLPIREGYSMVTEGVASLEEHAGADGLAVFKLADTCRKVPNFHVLATLTRADMEQNADAVIRHKRNRSRLKVEAWPTVCDTYAITILAGRAYFPDPREAKKRVKKMRAKKAAR